MGQRHIKGLHKLQSIGQQQFELVGVCDVMSDSAASAAQLASELLGTTPTAHSSLDEMRGIHSGLDAIIITTAPDTHAAIGVGALDHGVHVMVEKPVALTVSQGQRLVEAAARNRRTLAVAENYRRDPLNRLARAVIESGALGSIYLVVQSSSGAGEKVIITPWRHRRSSGGIVVDMGIHYADLLEYFLGPITHVFGFNSIVDKRRLDDAGKWHDVDAEDLSVGVVQFQSGAIGNWLIDLAGRGQGHFTRMVYGTGGTLSVPHDRSGNELQLTVRRDSRDKRLTSDETLALVPDFRLDDVTTSLFGSDRLTSYDLPFADVDANLLAIEQDDFARAIQDDRPPEVDGAFGLRSLAIAYGFMDAERLGRAVEINTLLSGRDGPYQAEIDAMLADS
jgi:predicted dehydrogenase